MRLRRGLIEILQSCVLCKMTLEGLHESDSSRNMICLVKSTGFLFGMVKGFCLYQAWGLAKV